MSQSFEPPLTSSCTSGSGPRARAKSSGKAYADYYKKLIDADDHVQKGPFVMNHAIRAGFDPAWLEASNAKAATQERKKVSQQLHTLFKHMRDRGPLRADDWGYDEDALASRNSRYSC